MYIACQKLRVTIATHKQDRGAPHNFKEILVAVTLITCKILNKDELLNLHKQE